MLAVTQVDLNRGKVDPFLGKKDPHAARTGSGGAVVEFHCEAPSTASSFNVNLGQHGRSAAVAHPALALQRKSALGARLQGHRASAPRARPRLPDPRLARDRSGQAARSVAQYPLRVELPPYL